MYNIIEYKIQFYEFLKKTNNILKLQNIIFVAHRVKINQNFLFHHDKIEF